MKSRRIPTGTLVRSTALAALIVAFSGFALPVLHAPSTADLTVWQVADGNERFTISGTVEAVSYASNSVRIGAGGQHVDVLVTPTTAIDVRGEAGSIADVHKGSKIRASGIVRSGQKIALSITLK